MTVNHDTFIHDMMLNAGFENIFAHHTSRYPEISKEEMIAVKPDIIFLSSEPFPFKEKHLEQMQIDFPFAKIFLVDGEMFSWYGSRLKQAPSYLKKVIDHFFNNEQLKG
jgi:ABC-type Fe3+-hydroxamate transport system substrate-binding protein